MEGTEQPKNRAKVQQQNGHSGHLKNQIRKEEAKTGKPRIVERHEANIYQIDNPYLLTGFRKDYLKFTDLFWSNITFNPIHNQYMNTWTHFAGTAVCVIFCFWVVCHLNTGEAFNRFFSEFDGFDFQGFFEQKKVFQQIEGVSTALQTDAVFAKKTQINQSFGTFLNGTQNISALSTNYTEIEKLNGYFHLIQQFKRLTNDATNYNYTQTNISGLDLAIEKLKHSNFIEELEVWPILVFLFSGIFCLGSSTVYHWFSDRNQITYTILQRIDFTSITIMIWGSTSAFFYYFFYCFPTYLKLHLGILTFCSFVVFGLSMTSVWNSEPYALTRTLGFIFLALIGAMSSLHTQLIHWDTSHGVMDTFPFSERFVGDVVPLGVAYILGSIFYASKIPERFIPKKFDIWMGSHVIWHFCVLTGAMVTYTGVLRTYTARSQNQCIPLT